MNGKSSKALSPLRLFRELKTRAWRSKWWGGPSAFPPCALCGGRYEAHEEVGIVGQRGHRVDAPGMPQHSQYHDFTPMPPDTPKTD